MLDLTGAERSVLIGDDCQLIYFPEEYEIDGTWVYTSKIFNPDTLVEVAEFSCPVEEMDLSEIDGELSGTAYVVVLALSSTQTAAIPEGTYVFDLKEVSPAPFTSHPIRRSVIEIGKALT